MAASARRSAGRAQGQESAWPAPRNIATGRPGPAHAVRSLSTPFRGISSPQFQHVKECATRGTRFNSPHVRQAAGQMSASATKRGQLQLTQRHATAGLAPCSRICPVWRNSRPPQRGQGSGWGGVVTGRCAKRVRMSGMGRTPYRGGRKLAGRVRAITQCQGAAGSCNAHDDFNGCNGRYILGTRRKMVPCVSAPGWTGRGAGWTCTMRQGAPAGHPQRSRFARPEPDPSERLAQRQPQPAAPELRPRRREIEQQRIAAPVPPDHPAPPRPVRTSPRSV